MAKITIAGNACVVTSSKTLADLQKLKKYNPEALLLKDAETKHITFMVDVPAPGQYLTGGVSPAGIVFNAASHDGAGLATLTLEMPGDVEDVNAWVMDAIGTAIIKLNTLEGKIDAALTTVAAEEAAVKNAITVMGATTAM